MDIPYNQLSPSALRGIIEDYVLREGTDYGERDYSLEQKVAQVMGLLERGEATITFDEKEESCSIQVVNRLGARSRQS